MGTRKMMVAGVLVLALQAVIWATPVSDQLVLKVDGSNVTSVVDGSDTFVTSWNDQSAQGNDFYAPTTDERPRLVSAGLNGYDTIKFDAGGVDEILKLDAPADDFKPGTGGFTVFMVMNLDTIGGGSYLFRKGNFASSADQGWSIWTDSTRLISRLNADDVNDDAHKDGRTHLYTNFVDNWVVYSMVMDGSSLATYLNGDDNYANIWNGGNYTGSVSPGDSVFMGINTNGQFAEVLAYKKALSESELNQVGYYLETKYNIDTTYTPEPATLALLGLGGLVLRRRRS